jgi:hypothetical protein
MTTTNEERSLRVANMRANFAHEGGVPDAEHEALLDRYVEGTATLADLYEHAREYLFTVQEREQQRLKVEALQAGSQRMAQDYEEGAKVYEEEQRREALANIGMSAEHRARHEAVRDAMASARLSGDTVSEQMKLDAARYVSGELTIDEFLALRGLKPTT